MAMSMRRSNRWSADAVRTERTPTGLAIGAGAVALVAAAIIAAAIPSADAGWRFAVMAVAVGVFAAISLDQIALSGVAVLASLIYNGFLEDRSGQLAWHGSGDLWRLLLLVTVSAGGLAIGESARFVANLRASGARDFDRAVDEPYGTELWADEVSRSAPLDPTNGHLPDWASNLASASELAGWPGPGPIDTPLIDTRPTAQVDRADTGPLAWRQSPASRPMSGRQASP